MFVSMSKHAGHDTDMTSHISSSAIEDKADNLHRMLNGPCFDEIHGNIAMMLNQTAKIDVALICSLCCHVIAKHDIFLASHCHILAHAAFVDYLSNHFDENNDDFCSGLKQEIETYLSHMEHDRMMTQHAKDGANNAMKFWTSAIAEMFHCLPDLHNNFC